MAKHDKMHPDDYDVGYKKPPKAHQFAKGHSGNPNGRPKGSKNIASILKSVFNEKVSITEHGRQRQVTKLEAATMQLANKAASGDLHSIRLMMQLIPGMEERLDQANTAALSDAQDRQVLAEMLKRMNAPSSEVIKPNDSATDEGEV